MEQLANLPPLALVVFGGTLAVIFAVRYFGLATGAKSGPANSPASAQVAAVIVDPTALNRLTDQAAKLNETLKDMMEITREKVRVDGLMATELDRIREELRIQREIGRRER
jgi:hypothetical protein